MKNTISYYMKHNTVYSELRTPDQKCFTNTF